MSFLCGAAFMLVVVGQVPLLGTSSVTVPLSAPSTCARCKAGFAGSPHDTWSGSAMAHAGRDPVFLAALVIAERDVRGIGDFCLRCHAPEAWLQGRATPTDGSSLSPDDSGVTCSVCHRMLAGPFSRNAQYVIADDSVMRGPFNSEGIAEHRTEQSTFLADSRACGVCHDVFSPLVRRVAGGGVEQPFPTQTTYSEWRASAFAREGVSCQNCHLLDSEGPVATSGPSHADRSEHGFEGGNLFLLDAIETLEPGLGVSAHLAAARARILDGLRHSAMLRLVAAQLVAQDRPVSFTIEVHNLTGHKLPTGYPDGRRVFLSIRSALLGLDLGSVDESSGDPIASPAVYETVHGQDGVGPGHHVALSDRIFKDSRIPPRGFIPTSTTAPVGKVYPETAPGSGVLVHFDEVTVTSTPPDSLAAVVCRGDAPDAIPVSIELRYDSAPKRFIEGLIAGAGSDPQGARLAAAYSVSTVRPVVIASLTFGLEIDRASFCSGRSADAGAADRADAPDAMEVGVPDLGQRPGDAGCDCRSLPDHSSNGGATAAVAALLALLLARSGRRERLIGSSVR